MESIGWSWRNLSAGVESKETEDAFFYSGAPVEAYQDCFYASAGTVTCRGGQRLASCPLFVSCSVMPICTVRPVAINEVLLQLCVWGPFAVIVTATWSKKFWRFLLHQKPSTLFLSTWVLHDDGFSACRGRPRVWVDCGDMHGVRCGAISQPERRKQTDFDNPHSILPDLFGDGSPLQHSNGSRTVCARSSKWFAATIHTALHILPTGLAASHVCL